MGVVLARSAVRAALSLAVVFVSLAALYILLSAPFIAVAQVMIYAGAVLILFLFVIMVLNPRLEIGEGRLPGQQIAALVVGVALIAEIVFILTSGQLASASGIFTPEFIAAEGDTKLVGELLFSQFLLPFEITSVVLLVAIIGAIALAKREKARN